MKIAKSFFHPWLFLFLTLATNISFVTSQDADASPVVVCGDGETLVEVELSPTIQNLEGFESLDIHFYPADETLSNQGRNLTEYQDSVVIQNDTALLPDSIYQYCIPSDTCFKAEVNLFILSSDSDEPRYVLQSHDVKFRENGSEVSPLPSIPYLSSGSTLVAFVGQCTGSCGEGETLLELSVAPISSNKNDWFVEDLNNGKVNASCDNEYSQWPWLSGEISTYYRPQLCLTSTGCYRFVWGSMGSSYRYAQTPDLLQIPTYNVTYRGKSQAVWFNPHFETLILDEFGSCA